MTDAGGQSPRLSIGANAVRVVVLTLLTIAVVVALLIVAAAKDTYEVRAVFDDVRGLIPGGDVTAGAIVVGTVAEVELNEDDNPEVTLEVSDEYRLYEGATANIRLGSNVGAVNRVVELEQGDPSKQELGDGVMLSGRQTDQPVDFDLAVSILTPKVRGQIKRILIGLDESLKNRGGDFDETLRYSASTLNETANLFDQVNEDGEALRTIVSEGATVVEALASSPADLGEAAERTATLLDVTAGRQAELAETAELLGPALAGGREVLIRASAATPNLRELIAQAGPLVDELGPFARLVPPTAEAADPFIQEVKGLVLETPGQLAVQKPFIATGQPIVAKLEDLLIRLNPIADYLRVYQPETVGFFQNVADSAAPYDLNGHLIRTASTGGNMLPPSTSAGGEIGPSACTPGQIVHPYHRTPGALECRPWEDFRDSMIADDYTEGGD